MSRKKKMSPKKPRNIIVREMILTRKGGPHLQPNKTKDDWWEEDETWDDWYGDEEQD